MSDLPPQPSEHPPAGVQLPGQQRPAGEHPPRRSVPAPAAGGDRRDRLLADAATRARRYLAGLDDRAVFPPPAAVAGLDRLDFPVPDAGLPANQVIELLDTVGSPATVASAGPRYFGFVTGGALPAAVAAAWMSAAWDQNGAMPVMSPVAGRLDAVALAWVRDLLGLPDGTTGAFVSGATMANVTCLAAARDAVLARAGWNAAADGLVGAPPITVVVGEEAHSAVIKALGIVGLGRARALRLPVDAQGRIAAGPEDLAGLPDLDGPAIVCLQAGNVNSGASDPFPPLIEWARSYNAWVHVDGAFGLWAAACPELAGQVAGVARADSWATDAHKWLNTTYDCGIALVADEAALRGAMGSSAAYLPPGPHRAAMQYGPQSSQRARGVEVWAALASLGRRGLAEMVAGHARLARRFADRLDAHAGTAAAHAGTAAAHAGTAAAHAGTAAAHAGTAAAHVGTAAAHAGTAAAHVEVLNEVVLNQVVVAFGDASTTEAVLAAVQADGTCWCGPTVWRGRPAMRISVSNWASTEADVDASADAILEAARSVASDRYR